MNMNTMNDQTMSVQSLLTRLESEIETADGRTVQVCRDAKGNYWVVDGAERIVSLSEFASDCGSKARQLCERERGKMFRQIAGSVKQAVARAAMALRPGTPAVHA
jgi:hypothetical protein